MEPKQKITDGSGQKLRPEQTLIEPWAIQYEAGKPGAPMIARLMNWPNTTTYLVRGYGETVEEARLNLITMLARAIHEDPNPFGDLGNVAHIAQVVKFLRALTDEGNEQPDEPGEFRQRSDYYLPDQLTESDKDMLPNGWGLVIGHVIDMLCSWADYYPEEGEITTSGEIAKEPEIEVEDDDEPESPFNQ